MKHFPYPKIPENLRRLKLDEADYRALEKRTWIVTEKVHGANFAVLADGDTVRFAKRKALLGDGEDFFGHSLLAEKLEAAVREFFGKMNEVRKLTVYGELFGGGYPHPDVAAVPGVQPVQTGVWYAPGIEFMVFDVAVEGGSGAHFLDFAEMRRICVEAGLLCTAPLFEGAFARALDFDPEFPTRIPALLGLPPLPDNHAEGIVIRPSAECMIPTAKGPVRPLIKKKTAAFSEDERYAGAEKWRLTQDVPEGAVPEPDARTVRAFLTKARLDNAISKTGKPSKRNRARIIREFADDALDAIRGEYPLSVETEELVRSMAREVAEIFLKK